MTKRIVLEGIWGSMVEPFTHELIKRNIQSFDTIKVGIGASPFNGLRGWVYSLTENMENWRESKGITIHQRSVWASYYYAKALAKDDNLSKAELDLFKDMTLGMAELNPLPDLVIYFHAMPKIAQIRLEQENSVCAEIGEDGLKSVSNSMIEWLDDMTAKGVKVIEIPPPMNDNNIDSWYNYAIKKTLTAIQEIEDGN